MCLGGFMLITSSVEDPGWWDNCRLAVLTLGWGQRGTSGTHSRGHASAKPTFMWPWEWVLPKFCTTGALLPSPVQVVEGRGPGEVCIASSNFHPGWHAVSVHISLKMQERHQMSVNNNRVSLSRFDLNHFYSPPPFLVHRLTSLSY